MYREPRFRRRIVYASKFSWPSPISICTRFFFNMCHVFLHFIPAFGFSTVSKISIATKFTVKLKRISYLPWQAIPLIHLKILFMTAVSVLVIIFLLQSCFGTSNSAPLFENVCRESDLCGKGNCLASNNSAFGYKCDCDSGWKQSGDQGDESLKFLPCVIPNCSWNNSCVNASAPAPNNDEPTSSFLDPCFWTDCGRGKCVKTSVFRSTCLCEDGYYNLFNATNFPCYKQCAFGVDCTSLGINLGNGSTSSSTAIPSTSYGISLNRRAGVVSLSGVMTILAMVVCHYV